MKRCAYCNKPLPAGSLKRALCCSVACADRLARAAAIGAQGGGRVYWGRILARLRG